MSKLDKIKDQYAKDSNEMSSKSRFGFFNIPATSMLADSAAIKKCEKDENGRVKTQNRNIFSGPCATGVLKKNCFSYTPSYVSGDVYSDPDKIHRKKQTHEEGKQTFKPVSSITKESDAKPAYEYVADKIHVKDPRQFRDENGKVKVQNPNMKTNNAFKTYEDKKKVQRKQQMALEPQLNPVSTVLKKKEKKDERGPFKIGSHEKDQFNTLKQTYSSVNMPEKKQKVTKYNIQEHDSKFRPQNKSVQGKYDVFSKYEYIQGKDQEKKATKGAEEDKRDAFKLTKIQKRSKPCPSISLSKLNIMRCLR